MNSIIYNTNIKIAFIFPEAESNEAELIPSNIQNNNKPIQNQIINWKIDLCNKELKDHKAMIEEQNKKINQLETIIKNLENENLKINDEFKNISSKQNINLLNIEKLYFPY